MRRTLLSGVLGGTLVMALGATAAHASQPIPIEDLARLPAIQSVTMDPSGQHLVGLIPSPTNKDETALATWDTSTLPSAPKIVTPSGEHMKFIGAVALKSDKILAVARQEWTGDIGSCGGEGNSIGSTKTFVSKVYLTGDDQKHFDEAFASNKTTVGVSKHTKFCLDISSTAQLVDMLCGGGR